jgi:hypothetical protein
VKFFYEFSQLCFARKSQAINCICSNVTPLTKFLNNLHNLFFKLKLCNVNCITERNFNTHLRRLCKCHIWSDSWINNSLKWEINYY